MPVHLTPAPVREEGVSQLSYANFLNQTLQLAEKGADSVPPNPMVGAVVVRRRRVVGTGYHAFYGGKHAETEALAAAGDMARGATLYCNLEPCSYRAPEKHQPPCTAGIVRAGIKRVILGQVDPNPRVCGNGIRFLKQNGVRVCMARDDSRFWHFNSVFNTTMALNRPFVHIKAAVSLDGKIAAAGGASRWITDAAARSEAHVLRGSYDAVAVGIGTVLADNPRLTDRAENSSGRSRPQPRAVVFDSKLRIPDSANLVSERASELVIVTVSTEDPGWQTRRNALTERGVEVVALPDRSKLGCGAAVQALSVTRPDQSERVSPADALTALGELGIRSLLVEGGSELITSFVSARLFDRFTAYIAPILMGHGIPLLGNIGVNNPEDAVHFAHIAWRRIGDQQAFEGARVDWLDEVRDVIGAKEEVERYVYRFD